jgi:hypothetical protein
MGSRLKYINKTYVINGILTASETTEFLELSTSELNFFFFSQYALKCVLTKFPHSVSSHWLQRRTEISGCKFLDNTKACEKCEIQSSIQSPNCQKGMYRLWISVGSEINKTRNNICEQPISDSAVKIC